MCVCVCVCHNPLPISLLTAHRPSPPLPLSTHRECSGRRRSTMVASRACLVGMRRNAKSLGCHWHPRGKPRRALRGAMSSRRKSGGGRATKETLRTNKQSNTYDCTCAFAWHKTPAVIQRMPAESLAHCMPLELAREQSDDARCERMPA